MSYTIVDTTTVVISSGESLSGAVNLQNRTPNALGITGKAGLRLFGIVMPSAWTAANLTFQASFDGGTTWVDVMDATGAEYVVTAGTSRYIPIDPTPFSAIALLRIRSGTSVLPVNQADARSLTLVLRNY